MTDAGMSGGKKVGSFVRLSTTNTEAMVSPLLGRTTSAPVSALERPTNCETPLICVWPEDGPLNVMASDALEPFGLAAVAATLVPRAETSVSIRFVRKLDPSNAPENVTGKRGPDAVNTSIPFIVKPNVPVAVLLYVRLVTLTLLPRAGVT